jgi:hypothetical protein
LPSGFSSKQGLPYGFCEERSHLCCAADHANRSTAKRSDELVVADFNFDGSMKVPDTVKADNRLHRIESSPNDCRRKYGRVLDDGAAVDLRVMFGNAAASHQRSGANFGANSDETWS